ncbi:hypothetical protein [Evansella tamaricis]|uniref:ABC-2 family transporter protein n=1 Tax=Evansella tamaricis TaxID=2069301 RepID=A0ABS6JK58_9BACI|nr:hypothetical protein [Evansella tamaricis]MBU9713928.1 hypothetical protein [Evansella tamaricis]
MRQALWLVKKELKYHYLSLMLTLVFIIFLALLAFPILEGTVLRLFGTEHVVYNRIMIDALFVLLLPCFGAIFMSKPYLSFGTIKEDPYSKRMALFRAMPIPVHVLALSRTFIMVITLLLNITVFYIIITLMLSDVFFQYLAPIEYVLFLLFWFCYALLFGGFNPFIENGTNGKVLHLFPYLFIAIFGVLLFVIYYATGIGLVDWSLLAIREYGFIAPVCAVIIAGTGCYYWNRLLTNRLRTRDYM